MAKPADYEMTHRLVGRVSAAVGLPLLLFCAQCAPTMSVYSGSGVLQTNGNAVTELAPHSVVLAFCQGDADAQPPLDPFSIVAIGDQCRIAGAGGVESFRPDVGSLCTLALSHGERTLRVTDVVARYADVGAPAAVELMGSEFIDVPESDSSGIEIQVGGDDVKNGGHALYRFSGRELGTEPAEEACDRERPHHERAVRGS